MTETQTTNRGTCVINTIVSGMRFEVYETTGEGAGTSYVGYCDGERSVVASRADIAARALARKHVTGLPEGKVIDFNEAKARRATVH